MPNAPTRSARCPNCARRGTFREHEGVMDTFERYSVETWQCIYCGAVCVPVTRGWAVLAVEPIVLLPGELATLRDARRGRETRHG